MHTLDEYTSMFSPSSNSSSTICMYILEFDCNLTREIVELVDREADLLNRGRSPKTMEGLRKRIASMFLVFIETPEFN
eukprot:scaffold255258_cov22-Prasinocladus_malaysianus.AAC.1